MLSPTRRKLTNFTTRVIFSLGVVGLVWLFVNLQKTIILEIFAFLKTPLTQTSQRENSLLTNIKIQQLEAEIAEVNKQNQQLKSLLKYSQEKPQQQILAPVIARSPDQWWDQIILGRGQTSGIKVGDTVSGLGGLVGRVIEVTPNTAKVLLISNPTSTLGAIITRNRSMGIVKGKGNQEMVMQFFEKVPGVKVGDAVMSSSVSQLFPTGYLVGYVRSIQSSQGPAPEAIIQMSPAIKTLEWVLVYSFIPAKSS